MKRSNLAVLSVTLLACGVVAGCNDQASDAKSDEIATGEQVEDNAEAAAERAMIAAEKAIDAGAAVAKQTGSAVRDAAADTADSAGDQARDIGADAAAE
ncbi:MAG: hypothetical protein GW859_06780 [Sphingomonadales bacterium]|nr:hypothetical protein [Sphingomonadales bacterium]